MMSKQALLANFISSLNEFLKAPEETVEPPENLPNPWESLAVFSVIIGIGLVILAYAYTVARDGTVWAKSMYYVGMLTLFVPATFRLLSVSLHRTERIGLIMLITIGLYISKVLHSPIGFTLYDEILHYRNALNLIDTGRLYEANFILPVGAFYPGLHIPTDALVRLTGLDLTTAGFLMIGIAKVALVLILFHIYEFVSQSARVAGIGAAIYITNQSFLLFNSQYSYESLALPLMMAVVATVIIRFSENRPDNHISWFFAGLIPIVSLTITHHITSYFMIGFLALWGFIFFFLKINWGVYDDDRSSPAWVTMLAFLFVLSWMSYVATTTLGYLVPVLAGTVESLVNIIMRESSGRQLFTAESGSVIVPLWEIIVVYITVLLITGGIGLGALYIIRNHIRKINYIALLIIGFGYPATQVFRFTERGPEITGRLAPSLYLGVGFVVALTVHYLWHTKRTSWLIRGAIYIVVVITFLGAINLSYASWGILPGPFLPAADTRSIQQESIETGRWMYNTFGPYNNFVADRINGVLINAYGQQNQVTVSYFDVFIPWLFVSTEWGGNQDNIVCDGDFSFIVTDWRLTQSSPYVGFYYEPGEPIAREDVLNGLPESTIEKFSTQPNLSLLYDSGNVEVYDARRFPCN